MKQFKFFTLLMVFQINAQVTQVTYEQRTNFGLPIISEWSLIFDQNKSYYFEKEKSDKKEAKSNRFSLDMNDNEKKVEKIDVKIDYREFLHHNFNLDTLFFQYGIMEKSYYVYEQSPYFKWEILKEKKTIKDYTCQKAKTHFRGRTYYVWFTTEIPTQTGPWKFNGLPGLILRVENSTSTILMKATKIQKKPDTTLGALITQIDFLQPKGERLSLKEFIPLKDNEFNEMIKKQSALRNSRNTTSVISKPAERQGFEKVYEWEEEEKEN